MMQAPRPSPTTPIAFVFDLGGVLLDWNPRYLFRRFFDGRSADMETFLAEIDFPAWNARFDRGLPFVKGVAEWCQRFPHYADLLQVYHTHWQETLAGPIQPVVDLLARLKQAGYSLYALSNWSAETFPPVRARYAFLSWFDPLIISGEVGIAKPEESIFRLLLERTSRQAAECLFIDDSEANILAARRLGFQTIRFLSPEQLSSELTARGLLPDF